MRPELALVDSEMVVHWGGDHDPSEMHCEMTWTQRDPVSAASGAHQWISLTRNAGVHFLKQQLALASAQTLCVCGGVLISSADLLPLDHVSSSSSDERYLERLIVSNRRVY